ncbi:hypothetical protein KHM83_15410 [Fusibacter paucivorans]|uniref:Glyoxalase n=1 Tax=Fusibacter paucivorans TaxID=76009 RepID=A0ABS5PSE3_9FIRM|nr:hypothetical protein [Fusibacter paucivorans]MBS7528073.1 hypothetical protein [Fusibacter paucivorans]
MNMKSVTGIGGIFFKAQDPDKMNDWYKAHLGLDTSEYGVRFEWLEKSDPSKTGTTQWSTFSETTDYFQPSSKDFMINHRVEILDQIETYDFGKFVHILDLEGNKIELWEPTDAS